MTIGEGERIPALELTRDPETITLSWDGSEGA
jgi:hypothetical protein